MDVISNIDYTRHFHLQLGFLPSLSDRHSGISLLLHHDQPCGEPSVVGNETSDYNQQETETCQQPCEWASSSPSQAFSSVQSLSHVRIFANPWTAVHQTSLSITNSKSLLRPMCIKWVMPSSHLIFYIPFSCLQSFPASGSFQMS